MLLKTKNRVYTIRIIKLMDDTMGRKANKQNLKLIERQINMGNELTIAAHGLSLGEKRIVMGCIAQLDSRKWKRFVYDPNQFRVKLTATEFAETYKIEPHTAYAQLKYSSNRLFERHIKRTTIDSKSGKKVTEKYVWVQHVKYHSGEGWIELTFSQKASEHLVGLTKNFTSYKLEQASALRSIYSWRLLEMFMQYQDTAWIKMSIEDFCLAMDVPEVYKTNFLHIRKRVLERSMNELRQKDNWLIDFKTAKTGRKITGLEFKFRRDPQQTLQI